MDSDPELAEAIRRSLGQPERPVHALADAEPAAKRRRVEPPIRDDQTHRIYNAPTVVRTRSVYAPASGGVSYPELIGDVRARAAISLIGQPSTLYSVILGAYCYDRDWVMSCLPDDVSVTVVRDTDRAGPGVYGPGDQRMQPPIRQHNLTEIIAPKPFGKSMMHIKASRPRSLCANVAQFLICFHATFTRIAIPTANCVDYECAWVVPRPR